MKLDYEILSKALYKLQVELGSSEAWEMITEESGVYHVKNMAEGLIKPKLGAWKQLHKTFPAVIPPPKVLADSYF